MLERMVLLLTIAHAANEETITRSRMEKKVIIKVSPRAFPKLIASIAVLIYWRVQCSGSATGEAMISLFDLNAFTNRNNKGASV